MLDTLNEWSQRLEPADTSQKSSATQMSQILPEKAKYVKHLHSDISYHTLALASFTCGAYARALQYLDLHLRGPDITTAWPPAQRTSPGLKTKTQSRYTAVFGAPEVEFLQKILSKLEEADALRGLVALRPECEPPKPGAWCKAV